MDFVELPIENLKVETIIMNQKKVDIDLKYFLDNDIIIISSGTATGKTKDIAKKSQEILSRSPKCKILSIVNLISLALEQISTFNDEGNIKLCNYQKTNLKTLNQENLVICINSLEKIYHLSDEYFLNTILYIDEVNNLIETLTHNRTLDNCLNIVYSVLIKLIKNCKKIILSDATINQNTLNLLSTRTSNNKTILIKNTHKKYEGIDAIKYNDANIFFQCLKDKIKNKDYFLFGCDICSKVTSFFNDLINEFPDQKDDFILITSKTNFYISNANNQFKDKYVFYSPSITTGVSFVYEDRPQTHFIYCTGQSVNPIGIYQMASRTRNMKELIYYSEEIKQQPMTYDSLENLEIKFKSMIDTNDRLLRISQNINKNDDYEIVENTYFKIFCYNEFLLNIFKTGFTNHFQNILKLNGFSLKELGLIKNLEEPIKRKQKILMDKIRSDEIDEFIKELHYDGERIEHDMKDTFLEIIRTDINYELFLKRHQILGLQTKDNILKYQIFLQDEHALTNLFNFPKLFRTEEFINNKIEANNKNCQKVKNISNSYTKIKLLRKIEEIYKIDRLDLTFKNISIENTLKPDEIDFINVIFRSKKNDLSTTENVIKLYINMIKHICGDLPIIISSQIGKKKIRVYTLNIDTVMELILLTKLKNPFFNNYNKELIEKMTNIKPEIKPVKILSTPDEYIEAEEMYNTYLFGKIGSK